LGSFFLKKTFNSLFNLEIKVLWRGIFSLSFEEGNSFKGSRGQKRDTLIVIKPWVIKPFGEKGVTSLFPKLGAPKE